MGSKTVVLGLDSQRCRVHAIPEFLLRAGTPGIAENPRAQGERMQDFVAGVAQAGHEPRFEHADIFPNIGLITPDDVAIGGQVNALVVLNRKNHTQLGRLCHSSPFSCSILVPVAD